MINCYVTPLPKYVNRETLNIDTTEFNVYDWRDEYCIFYDWYIGNRHHWIIPNAIEFLKRISNIEGFELNTDFKYIRVKVGDKKYSGKTITDVSITGEFEVNNYSIDYHNRGGEEVLHWDKDKMKWYTNDMFTEYHSSFYGSHSISTTINHTCKNNKSIIVFSDSMSVAISKILINSFYKCTIIDSRHFNVNLLKDMFNIDDYDYKFVMFTQDRKEDVLKYYNKAK